MLLYISLLTLSLLCAIGFIYLLVTNHKEEYPQSLNGNKAHLAGPTSIRKINRLIDINLSAIDRYKENKAMLAESRKYGRLSLK